MSYCNLAFLGCRGRQSPPGSTARELRGGDTPGGTGSLADVRGRALSLRRVPARPGRGLACMRPSVSQAAIARNLSSPAAPVPWARLESPRLNPERERLTLAQLIFNCSGVGGQTAVGKRVKGACGVGEGWVVYEINNNNNDSS